ncbi:MAG TPA: extracellular solute-binding protein [Allocoleopsis sp.]
MKRRDFFFGSSSILLTGLLSSCGNSPAESTLNIKLLRSSIPPQLIDKFSKQFQQKLKLNFTPEVQLKTLSENLQKWENPNQKDDGNWFKIPFVPEKKIEIPDLITFGDYWLKPAIAQNLIQPIDIKSIKNWQNLPEEWKKIVTRNTKGEIDPSGQIWGIPYRWGYTMIAYREDEFKKLGWSPTDWGDLWRPEIQDKISLLNQSREVIGLTLKKLGYSYNTKDLSTIPNLKIELKKLHQQVKLYSSNSYLQPLILGDTWLTVGWSRDLILLSKREPGIKLVIPKSGTSLWTDIWVRPNTQKKAENIDLQNQWLDFCLQTEIANQISLFNPSPSPVLLTMKPTDIPDVLRENKLILPGQDILSKSEFLQPLSIDSIKQYRQFWQEMRNNG